MSAVVISSLAYEVPPPTSRRANDNDDNGCGDDHDPPTVRSASYADVPCVRESHPPDTLPEPSHAPVHAPLDAALEADDETLLFHRDDLPV